MPDEKEINQIHDVRKSLVKGGININDLNINVELRSVVVIKPTKFLNGELWNRVNRVLRDLGYFWHSDEEGQWVRGALK